MTIEHNFQIGLPAILSIAQWLTQKQTEFDAVGLLLPGLSHMTADENLLKLVVDGGGLPLCVEYFRYTVVSIIKAMPVNEEMDTMNRKLIGVLIVLLNLLIANEKATELCWVVPLEDLFGLIGKVWIQKAGQCLDPTVTAHLVAIYLQLALCLHSAKNNKEIEQ